MIEFKCPSCGRMFRISDRYAGLPAHCKGCGTGLVIPAPAEMPPSQPHMVISLDELPPAAHPPAVSPPFPPLPTPAISPPATQSAMTPPIAVPIVSTPAVPTPLTGTATEKSVPGGGSVGHTSVRSRRLQADAEQIARAFRNFSLIRVSEAIGRPPELYRIEYRIRGLVRGNGGVPIPREQHVAEIQLTREYPRQSPKCKMLTPIFHPNIEPAVICVGDHWTAGESLVDLVIRIGEMIAYQAYNIKSPLDGEAAKWADLNRYRLPIDTRDLDPQISS